MIKTKRDLWLSSLVSRSIFLLALTGLVFAPACSRQKTSDIDVVAAHSEGVISAAEAIRIRFARDICAQDQLGKELGTSPVFLRPKVDGVARWTAPDVLSFQPAGLLKPGRHYEVSVDLGAALPSGSGSYGFDVDTMGQSLELGIEGLETRGDTSEQDLRLRGELRTADVAAPEKLEKVLKASMDGENLVLSFSHGAGGRLHPFVVEGISRGPEDRQLLLKWDGGAIGAESSGQREIQVIRKGVFAISSIRTVQDGEKRVEIRCSEIVDPSQEIRGLIRVGSHQDLRFDRHENLIKVFATGGWQDEEKLRIDPGLRSAGGRRLGTALEKTLHFQPPLPSLRFATKGIIVPSTRAPGVPIEVNSLRAFEIEARQIFSDNMPQFFQVNSLEDTDELRRVGRVVWKKRVVLDATAAPGESRRVSLDLSPLVAAHPGGMYHLKLRFSRADITTQCSGEYPFPTPAVETNGPAESSYWDQWEGTEDFSWRDLFDHRKDPCHPGFYRSYYDHDIVIEKNVLLSNLGLIAKKGEGGQIFVLATDLRSAAPLSDVEIRILDFQQQSIGAGRSGPDGTSRIQTEGEPFLVVARSSEGAAYLKLDEGQALSFSRFNIGGAEAVDGLKGFIYAERGVWRPGDEMHLAFILSDEEDQLPADHPISFELRNPMDQLVQRETQQVGKGPIFVFQPRTAPDARTGNYRLRVQVGAAAFDKTIKVAMVRPNRLRIALESGESELLSPRPRLRGILEAAWLHGGEAGNMEARIEGRLQPVPTKFSSYPDFLFDDPTRDFDPEELRIFDGELDAHGRVRLDEEIPVESPAPGKLKVVLTTRVFEPGGAFSINETAIALSPWESYVGLRTEPGDATRGMLLTDTEHRVDLALVDQHGKPLDGDVKISLYKISWRWWWEKGRDESLVDFAQSSSLQAVASGKVRVKGGEGRWNFSVAYPEWGRFLLLAEDPVGGHRAAKVVYIDWPGWAGKARKGAGDSAEVLSLSSDRDSYAPGDEVELSIPSAAPGKILISLEKGGRVLKNELIEASAERSVYRFKARAAMSPNIYAVVSFLQPHEHPQNDLPIRMYGVLPISIGRPDSHLQPEIEAPEVFKPESSAKIRVSEAEGRAMDYSLAVVDEGLLGLTGFETPDPWGAFFRKEALGVRTWDLYGEVAGAWGSALEEMLAVGGGESGSLRPGAKKERRFPPMVRFFGPFHLKAGETAKHKVDIPLYLGSVRVMVVAAGDGAFGRAEKEVPVRKKLMVLSSLPRRLAPDEELQWPVSVFVMEGGPSRVKVEAGVEGPAILKGEPLQFLDFSGPGEKLIGFPLRAGPGEGQARFSVEVHGGGESSRHEISLEVYRPAAAVSTVERFQLESGGSSQRRIDLAENREDTSLRLEVSRIPPMDLGRRLDELIHYPYGCLEQTTSAAFPQLYLGRLVDLSEQRRKEIQKNVSSAIERIRQFQLPGGGLSLWPVATGGFWSTTPQRRADPWVSSYAGHFMLEAKRAGYRIPTEILQKWESSQRQKARGESPETDTEILAQAYRLQTLALAGAPELGSMNRLRETPRLPDQARWQLASAYALTGRMEAARELVSKASRKVRSSTELGGSYASPTRDRAILSDSLSLLGFEQEAAHQCSRLSEDLNSDRLLSTQATAFALMAIARQFGDEGEEWGFSYELGGDAEKQLKSKAPVIQRELEPRSGDLKLDNPSPHTIFVALTIREIPARSEEKTVSQGLKLEGEFLDDADDVIDPSTLTQGMDLSYVLKVTGRLKGRKLENLALSIPLAEGWEIRSVEEDGAIDYRDIRDNRVDVFFDLDADQVLELRVGLTASFLGRYYLPMSRVEAMYDPAIAARLAGRWVKIVEP